MRKILALAIASTFLTATPVIPQPAEAGSFFEELFPRAAQRRRDRSARRREAEFQRLQYLRDQRLRQIKRARRAKVKKSKPAVKFEKVKSVGFKTYYATKLSAVRLASLSGAFSAHEQKILAADALRKERIEREKQVQEPVVPAFEDASVTNDEPLKPILISQSETIKTTASVPPIVELQPVRLSAGHALLGDIKLSARKSMSKAVVDFYQNNPGFIWVDGQGQPTETAKRMVRVLADAASFGLNPEDYNLATISSSENVVGDGRLKSAMTYEFSLTLAALRYTADAQNGVVDPNRISGYHDFKGLGVSYSKILGRLAKASAPDDLMLEAHPQEAAFQALKRELKTLRKASEGYDAVPIKSGTFLKPGGNSDQLENIVESIRRKADKDLRENHFDVFATDHTDGKYSKPVVDMIRDFQQSVNLSPDGIIGKNTIARMVGDNPAVRLNKVLYAMERLRWHPDSLGNRHVFINQPAYKASYINGGKTQLSMRAIVGKASNQTNFFHDKISYVEYNPYWGIPRSILVNEMLPKLRRNSSYFDNIGYEVTNTQGQRISSSSVNWSSVGTNFPYNVRQPPGSRNALGELKIMFPNKHSIYMHDTPSRGLFKRSARALSHGCVRLADPRGMAAAVLGSDIEQVSSKLADGENKTQKLPSKVPVYVSYFTAWPDEAGDVKFYGDIYGRDKALAKAMAVEARERSNANGA